MNTWLFKIDDEFNGRGHAYLFVDNIKALADIRRKQVEINEEEVQSILERTLSTGNLDGLGFIFEYFRLISFERAIQEGQRVREKFPTSTTVLKILADVYKRKVYSMREDSQERQAWAQKGIGLFEEVVRDYPDNIRGWISLATLHCYAHNTERADEIYQQLLSEEDDLPPHTQQLLYHSYACHLYYNKQSRDLYQRRWPRDQSIDYHMKAAAIQNISQDRQKSIMLLKKTVKNGRNSRCEEISKFLKIVLKDE